ncbi:unnamed protein product [Pylaiella littoralis]
MGTLPPRSFLPRGNHFPLPTKGTTKETITNMPFDVLLGVRKPDQGLIQVVEAAGLLLGIQNTAEGHGPESNVYRTVPPGSIYGPTLQAITQQPTADVLERLRLLDTASITDEIAHQVFAKTLKSGFAAAGNARGSPGLAPPWTSSSAFTKTRGRPASTHHNSYFADSLEDSFGGGGSGPSTGTTAAMKSSSPAGTAPGGVPAPWNGSSNGDAGAKGVGVVASGSASASARSEVDASLHALKLAVVGVTRRLVDDVTRLPLQDRTTAVLIDGSRMSLLALELAGAAWKFGRFVVIHVSGEKHPSEIDDDSSGDDASNSDNSGGGGAGPECEEDASTTSREKNEGGVHSEAAEERVGAGDRHGGGGGYDGGDEGRGCGRGGGGRWEPGFLEAELREACVRQLEIPEESLHLVFRSLPPGSSGTVDEVTKVIGNALDEHGVEVVFMGCYGRRGPRVTQFGAVAHWALEHTSYQIVFAKKFSPSMVSAAFFNRPKRYLVAVTSDLQKASHTLDRLLPLVLPRDSVVLIHIVDECAEDALAGEEVDVEKVKDDLSSLLSHKRGLCHRVRVEKTGRPPENPTQTVVQRVVRVAEEEAADFLAILYDESRGSYRTVATGCLREARCGLIAIH